jgi:pimeloyl-ACP methyl ester carboxylesterase
MSIWHLYKWQTKITINNVNQYFTMKTSAIILLLMMCLSDSLSIAQTQEQNIFIAQTKGVLDGTLLIPTTPKTMPLLIIVAGSGATDRNGNGGSALTANSYQLLAEGLAAKGIATLRYDKRGIGKSRGAMTKEIDLRFETYSHDIEQWIDTLKKDARFSNIIVLGHSEGSLLGMLAIQNTSVNGYISLAGAGREIDTILNEQFAKQALPDSVKKEIAKNLAILKTGQTVPKLMQNFVLFSVFRTSVQPYMISWIKYNPVVEIKKITVPTLIIQGNTDIQVPESDAYLLAKAKPNARLLIIEGMNHVLKNAPLETTENIKVYTQPDLPLSKGLVEGIVEFVRNL